MENLRVVAGAKTPLIEFKTNGELNIEGRSIPENSVEFYQPSLNWVKDFSKDKPAKVNLHMKLDHFNTSSSKIFFDIFRTLELLQINQTDVNIYWYYPPDSETMLEAGEDYKSIIKVPFHLVKL